MSMKVGEARGTRAQGSGRYTWSFSSYFAPYNCSIITFTKPESEALFLSGASATLSSTLKNPKENHPLPFEPRLFLILLPMMRSFF